MQEIVGNKNEARKKERKKEREKERKKERYIAMLIYDFIRIQVTSTETNNIGNSLTHADSPAGSSETLHILRNLKVHYLVQNSSLIFLVEAIPLCYK